MHQRRADSREGAAVVVQQYTRAYQGRMLARHLYRRAVRRDRREMRSKRRVARMARYEHTIGLVITIHWTILEDLYPLLVKTDTLHSFFIY